MQQFLLMSILNTQIFLKNVQFMQRKVDKKLLNYHWYIILSLLTYAIVKKVDFLMSKIRQHVIRFCNVTVLIVFHLQKQK